MRRFLLVLLLMTSLSLPALAASPARPPELEGKIAATAPYGAGSFSKMLLHVYDAALWTDAKTWSADTTYALEIRYAMNFSTSSLVDRSISEMERSGKMSADEKSLYYKDLAARFHDVKSGDIITALYVPKKGGYFYYNGKPQGTVMDAARMQRFLGIWLGAQTSEPELRAKLLAKN